MYHKKKTMHTKPIYLHKNPTPIVLEFLYALQDIVHSPVRIFLSGGAGKYDGVPAPGENINKFNYSIID